MAIKMMDSSMVYAVDYDAKAQTLEVAFKRNGVFVYTGVPPVEHRRLMKSDSIGSYMRSCIIGMYPERRMCCGETEPLQPLPGTAANSPSEDGDVGEERYRRQRRVEIKSPACRDPEAMRSTYCQRGQAIR
jgi:hypothetical protein